MAIRDMFKVSRKTFLNPMGWFGWESMKEQNQVIWGLIKGMFVPAKPIREESFEAAMQRLDVTEDDVRTSITRYRTFALIFLILGVISFAYAFFLLFYYGTITGWLLGIAVAALFGSQAFKFDFWAFQMSRRQLGLTFTDWRRNILGEKGPPQ